jgi:hypothetical protein
MVQDPNTGLWVPESARSKPRPNFPPKLDVPEDAKGPTRISDIGAAMAGGHFWYYPSRDPRPVARPPVPFKPFPENVHVTRGGGL